MEELLSEIMKLHVHAMGKKLDEDIMADGIKLNRDQADNIIEKIDYLDSNNLIYAHKMREAIESLVGCQHQYILGVCRLCGHRNDIAEPSYKKRDREYWKDIEDKEDKEDNHPAYLISYAKGVDDAILRLQGQTDNEIAKRLVEEYYHSQKHPFLTISLTNFSKWLNQE